MSYSVQMKVQGCCRSHPHEDMNVECEKKTLEAKVNSLTARLEAAEKENARLTKFTKEENGMQPIYFVRHPDGTYTEAAPQPIYNSTGLSAKTLAQANYDNQQELESRITEQAAQIEALKKDAERLNWMERLFTHSWNGTIGTCSATYWQIVGDYRHRVAKMIGHTFREAIDSAMEVKS